MFYVREEKRKKKEKGEKEKGESHSRNAIWRTIITLMLRFQEKREERGGHIS